jgi:glycine/D-amino acid oxidase-like deaminating enzyme
MAATCDILIVGGGVIGVSIAFHLARRQAGRIVLLEKAYLGAGGSGKELAQLWLHEAHAPTAALYRHSLRAFEHIVEEVGGPRVLVRTGAVLIAAQADRDGLQAVTAAGPPFVPLETMELLELDPNVHLADNEIALLDREAGALDGVQVIASYAEAARHLGADICQGVEVQRFTRSKGKATGVETNEGAYECGTLVLAAGPWSGALARDLGAVLPVQAYRVQTGLFRRPLDSGRRGVILLDRVQGLLIMPGPDYYIRAAELALHDEPAVDADQFDEAPTGDWLAGLRQRLSRRCPVMHRAYGRGGYGALTDRTPDGKPLVDRLPGLDGVVFAAGFGNRAVALAPIAGQLVAELVTTGKGQTVDLTPFQLERFATAEET